MFSFSKNIPSVTAEQVNQALDTKANVIFVDVRTPAEYKRGHLEKSVLLPVDNIAEKAESIFADKTKTLYVYCLSGSRSIYATKVLRQLGYTNVFNMNGGLLQWRGKGYSTTTV